jgi:hypothetical protein
MNAHEIGEKAILKDSRGIPIRHAPVSRGWSGGARMKRNWPAR